MNYGAEVPNNSMQRTALCAAADAGRCAPERKLHLLAYAAQIIEPVQTAVEPDIQT